MSATDRGRKRSLEVTGGPAQAAARSMLRAMGWTTEDLQLPQAGVAATWNRVTPCNMHLDELAVAAADELRSLRILPLLFHTISSIQDVYEGIGAQATGRMTLDELTELECVALPGKGSCASMYTANTMASVSEALGLTVPGMASPAAEDPEREAIVGDLGRAHLAGGRGGRRDRDPPRRRRRRDRRGGREARGRPLGGRDRGQARGGRASATALSTGVLAKYARLVGSAATGARVGA